MSVYELCVNRLPGFHPQAEPLVSSFVRNLRNFFQEQTVTDQIQIGRFVNRHRGNLFVVPDFLFNCPITSRRHCYVGGFCSCVCLFSLVDNPELKNILQKLVEIFQDFIIGATRRDSLALVSFVDRYGKLILGPVK
jgi:hypothetical protein